MQFLEHFYQDPALNIKMNYNNSRFYFPFDNENNRPSYTTSNTGDDLVFHNLYKVQSMALATIPNTIIPISIEIALDIYYVADVTFVPTFAKKTKSDVIEQQIKGQCIYTSNYNSYVDIFNSKNRKILSRSQLR